MQGEGLTCVNLLLAPGGGPGNNPASPLAEEREATIAHYKEVVDLAHDLGADNVLYIAGWRIFGTEQGQDWERSPQALSRIPEHAEGRGITVCIEPTWADSNLVDTAGEALALREQIGRPNVEVMFDTYHALYRNEPGSDYVYEMAPHLAHVDFADTDRGAPGEGAVDWYGVLQALKDIKFSGHVTRRSASTPGGPSPTVTREAPSPSSRPWRKTWAERAAPSTPTSPRRRERT